MSGTFRRESYRSPYGFRDARNPGTGRGTVNEEARIGRAREATPTDDATAAWLGVLTAVADDWLRECEVALWLAPLELLGEEGGDLVIAGLPSQASWVRRRYLPGLSERVRELTAYGLVLVVSELTEAAVA